MASSSFPEKDPFRNHEKRNRGVQPWVPVLFPYSAQGEVQGMKRGRVSGDMLRQPVDSIMEQDDRLLRARFFEVWVAATGT